MSNFKMWLIIIGLFLLPIVVSIIVGGIIIGIIGFNLITFLIAVCIGVAIGELTYALVADKVGLF